MGQDNGSPSSAMIDDNPDSLRRYATKFNVTEDQIRDAIKAVGSNASDVEEHLKGSRTTTNSEKVRNAL